jgi:hypothetical protein
MPLGHIDDFPESTLNDEDYSPRRRGITNGRGYQTHPLYSGISRSNDLRKRGDNPFSQGTPPPSLLTDGTQGANISITSSQLTLIGKTSNVHWPQHGVITGSDATTASVSSSKSEGTSLSHTTGSMAQQMPRQGRGAVSIIPREAAQPGTGVMSESQDRGGHTAEEGEVLEVNLALEPSDAHPKQLLPTLPIYTLAQSLYASPPATWSYIDVQTPFSSDGASVLLSIFVDYAAMTLRPDMTLSQRLSLAQIATTTAPQRLFRFLRNPSEAWSYIEWALSPTTTLPPVMENHLYPMATLELIVDETLREKARERVFLRSQKIDIIHTFTECYYPAAATASLKEALKKVTMETIDGYLNTAGELVKAMCLRNRTMHFSPPRWYRLSVHPTAILGKSPTMPRGSMDSTDISTVLPFNMIQGYLPVYTDLVGRPYEQQKTAILSAIPQACLGNQTLLSKLPELITKFHGATQEQILNYISTDGVHSRSPSMEGDSTMPPAQANQVVSGQHFLHHIRLEHMDGKARWTDPSGAVLKKWLSAVAPINSENSFHIELVSSIYDKKRDNVSLQNALQLTDEQLGFFTYFLRSSKRLYKLEFWITSNCANMLDFKSARKVGHGTTSYLNELQHARIWFTPVSTNWVTVFSLVMLVGSLETDNDSIAQQELRDRIELAGADPMDIPPFFISWCQVAVSSGRSAMMAKCIMAYIKDVEFFHQTFSTMPTEVLRTCYLVTRKFSFCTVAFPSTDRSDKRVGNAIRTHQELLASMTYTEVHGLNGVDPFYHVPSHTRASGSEEYKENTRTVAALILLGSAVIAGGSNIPSPVTRITLQPEGTMWLHGPKSSAADLIQYTTDLVPLMDEWMGTGVSIKCEEARIHVAHAAVPEGGEGIKQSVNTEMAVFQTASNDQRLISDNVEISGLCAAVEANTSHIAELSSKLTAYLDRQSSAMQQDDLKSTLSTLVTMTIQSSMSSISDSILETCRTFLAGHTESITQALKESADQLARSTDRLNAGNVTLESHQKLVAQFAETLAMATRTMQELKDHQGRISKEIDLQQSSLQEIIARMPKSTACEPASPSVRGQVEAELTPDHDEARAWAYGVLGLLPEVIPDAKHPPMIHFCSVTQASEPMGHPTPKAPPEEAVVCNKCQQTGHGLLYCDRCPQPMAMFHPECLTRVENSSD